ncbi:hypothetical protein G7074_17760 [Pedobacter sp. HDW13]|uniref:hypothetical protein n=1 Tax=unclassified Pedobacter TaxID=2628915 RepID=UPI000F5918C9|nr:MULTISPECIES: hypothetical protein [unclassified Pedobacter]QIL40948.1 hypothetical protein G7074_17760 [Pedobacter sp. HDW13]RQO64992.1 hypothetical protein DBR40_24255 [Pedobacter sp. KBW01]
MKLKITPLNIVSAAAVSFLVLAILDGKSPGRDFEVRVFYKLILGCLVAVTFITDLIFRFTLKDIKRIWLIESIFIVITAILMLILQKVL